MAVQSRQARRLDQAKTLAFSSLPAALIGGFIVLDERLYNAVTGAVLLIAAAILIVGQTKDGLPDRATPLWEAITTGAVVGFVSGLTGVGGGVFLAPILIALRWASPKQTSALSAPFILANSAVGLIGALYAGQMLSDQTWLYAIGAFAGAMIGTTVGIRWLSQVATRYVLAGILGTAGVQLLIV